MYKRKILEKVLKFTDTDDILVIYGARQVGKTTLVKYILEHHITKPKKYIDLENIEMLELCNEGPEALVKYIYSIGLPKDEKIVLVIDEVQHMENPSNFLKLMHDHFKNIKLIVSGSSTFEIRKRFKDSLAGRTVNFTLYPLDFEEFLTFKQKQYKISSNMNKTANNELVKLAEEFIKFGGYPKIVLENDVARKKEYINQLVETYIQKDIRDLGNISNVLAFNKLLRVLAEQSGELLNVTDISNIVGLSRVTVENYMMLLENTFVIKCIYPFHKKLRIELSKNPKVFFIDNGLMNILGKKTFPEVVDGNVFENFFFSELLKNKYTINFWRTTNKQEIDFIVNEEHPIELKINFSKAKSSAIKFFKEKYGLEGFFVCLYGKKNGFYPWEMIKKLSENSRD